MESFASSQFLNSFPFGAFSAHGNPSASQIMSGDGTSKIYQTVAQYAGKLLYDERALFKELVEDLKLFKTSPSYSAVPASINPPNISLSRSLRRLSGIVCKNKGQTEPTTEELRQVPELLEQILKLLRVYYNYQVFGDDSPDLILCDVPDPAIISYHLSLAGQMIMCDARLFNRFLDEVPNIIERTFLYDPLGRGEERINKILVDLHFCHAAGAGKGRPSLEARKELFSKLLKARAYRVYHHYMYFLAPIWISCSHALKGRNDVMGRKAFALHLEHTCLLDSIFKCGDSAITVILNSPLFLIQEGRKWFQQWFISGGLPSLFYGTTIPGYQIQFRGIYQKMLEVDYRKGGPKELAINQIQEFVEFFADSQAINIEGLKPKLLSQETLDRTLYFLYKYKGSGIFRAGALSTLFSPMFAFLAERTQRHQKRYLVPENFYSLCKKYQRMPKGVLRKYQHTLYNPAYILTAIDDVGCMNSDCPDRKRMMNLRTIEKLEWSHYDLLLVNTWGQDLKLCSGCRKVAYCSRKCQKEDWGRHKVLECSSKGKKRN